MLKTYNCLTLDGFQTPTWQLSHCFSSRRERRKQFERKVVAWDKDRKITYQLPSQAK